MAWLRELNWKCRVCQKIAATVELLGRQNESYGKFCKRCGEKRLKEQLDYEQPVVAAKPDSGAEGEGSRE